MKFVNLTPHEVKIYNEEGNKVIMTIPSSGLVRVSTKEKIVGDVCGIPIVEMYYGEVNGLPEAKDGVVYIVSRFVLMAVNDRNDLVAPNTSDSSVVRDENGRIVGVRRFVR